MDYVVLVLGDVGRSPRMQYHALSLANHEETNSVQLVGIDGERCIPQVEGHKKIHKVALNRSTTMFQGLPRALFLLYAPVKVLVQIIHLFYVLLFTVPMPHAILIQNPPCIPTFFVVLAVAKLRMAAVVIDWHNLGYTILKMNLGEKLHHKLIVSIAEKYERFFGRFADYHLCVTDAMKDWLHKNFGIERSRMVVLHDKSPEIFKPMNLEEKHEFLTNLDPSIFGTTKENKADMQYTLITKKDTSDAKNGAELRDDAPAIVISSTSWTPDEDFGVLFDAIKEYDHQALSRKDLPFTYFVVTGKGPQKEVYMKKVNELSLQRAKVVTPWLESEDYPKMLGVADLGVSLHTSSSKVDLPMKVIDMFGAGIPVCAMSYECLAKELVHENENGLLFNNSAELARHLCTLLSDRYGFLESLRKNVQKSWSVESQDTGSKWEGNWDANAWPIFRNPTNRTPIFGTGCLLIVLNVFFVALVAVFVANAPKFEFQ